MSASTAIGMVGESLRNLLLGEMQITPPAEVTLLGPDETGPSRRLNLFLFKVEENPFLRNQDWQRSTTDPTRIAAPPLALNLYYLITPYAANDQQTGNTPAHEILGEAMRVLYENAIVPDTYLVAGLSEATEQIRVMQVPVDIEELSQVWSTFKQAFRTSVLYEISVVELDQAAQTQRPMPQRVRQIGVPRITAPFAPPRIDAVAPAACPAGSMVTISGRHLTGWQGYVSISGRTVSDGIALNADSFTVMLPVDLEPGFHQLSIDVSHLAMRTFFIEITP